MTFYSHFLLFFFHAIFRVALTVTHECWKLESVPNQCSSWQCQTAGAATLVLPAFTLDVYSNAQAILCCRLVSRMAVTETTKTTTTTPKIKLSKLPKEKELNGILFILLQPKKRNEKKICLTLLTFRERKSCKLKLLNEHVTVQWDAKSTFYATNCNCCGNKNIGINRTVWRVHGKHTHIVA